MKLTFLGANHEVTGSCTLLEAAGQRYLIDCGMEQGKDVYENQPIPVAPGEIDGVLATHAHIDHTGLLPLLVRNGFRSVHGIGMRRRHLARYPRFGGRHCRFHAELLGYHRSPWLSVVLRFGRLQKCQ